MHPRDFDGPTPDAGAIDTSRSSRLPKDAPADPAFGTVQLTLSLVPADDDRLHGLVALADGGAAFEFSGTLELLACIERVRRLETTVDDPPPPSGDPSVATSTEQEDEH